MIYTKPTVEELGTVHSLTLAHGNGQGNHDPDACNPENSSGKCFGVGDGLSMTGFS